MIKCKVTLAGVVNKAATTHEGKDGKPFVSFGVNLPLGDKNGNCREFEVSVSADPAIATAGLLSIGKRVQVVGTLYFRKRDNTMYLNMYADSITIDVSEIDKLEGEMEFKGRTGNKSILLLSDKRKKQFQAFSAYSKEAAPDGPVDSTNSCTLPMQAKDLTVFVEYEEIEPGDDTDTAADLFEDKKPQEEVK